MVQKYEEWRKEAQRLDFPDSFFDKIHHLTMMNDWEEERTILKTLLKKCYDCFNSCEQDGFNNGVFTSEIMQEIKDILKS